jgi:hypothetical protein
MDCFINTFVVFCNKDEKIALAVYHRHTTTTLRQLMRGQGWCGGAYEFISAGSEQEAIRKSKLEKTAQPQAQHAQELLQSVKFLARCSHKGRK